jgi:hypothetical protein
VNSKYIVKWSRYYPEDALRIGCLVIVVNILLVIRQTDKPKGRVAIEGSERLLNHQDAHKGVFKLTSRSQTELGIKTEFV